MTPTLPEWTAVIPIRGGSKGLANKNIRQLAGQPLYQHSLAQALDAGASRIIITTDIPQVLEAAHPDKVTVIERPAELCTDATPMNPVVCHALTATKTHGIFVLLQATSPLRRVMQITQCLQQHATGKHDLVFTVVQADSGVLKWGYVNESRFVAITDIRHCFSNRQSLPPVFRPNGAIYVADSQWFLTNGGFESDNIGVVTMSSQDSIDIDTQDNLDACEAILYDTWSSAA